ncbi:hypothetical protein I7I48_07106 [Histoplasma ohiense]|nr:hypothetical protein I7I48_07106 [Histoplasma ohiense (nom. inval.)]
MRTLGMCFAIYIGDKSTQQPIDDATQRPREVFDYMDYMTQRWARKVWHSYRFPRFASRSLQPSVSTVGNLNDNRCACLPPSPADKSPKRNILFFQPQSFHTLCTMHSGPVKSKSGAGSVKKYGPFSSTMVLCMHIQYSEFLQTSASERKHRM